MKDEIKEYYEQVKDIMTEDEFIEKLEYYKEQNKGAGFINEVTCAMQVVSEATPDEEKKMGEVEELKSEDYNIDKIANLKESSRNDFGTSISGTVMSIGDPKVFKTKNGKKGKLANVVIADDTGSIRTTFWTENIKLLKNFKEGDIIQINNVSIRNNSYSNKLEANLSQRSTVIHLDEDKCPNYPKYVEEITKIADIDVDMDKVNIIARITRIPNIKTFEKNGRDGKVVSLDLVDDSGEISYTLWNASVDLIKLLGLEDGDTVKILGAVPREGRDGEISLNHQDGRIIKGDYDAPEVFNEITKITDVKEQDDVNICGVITKVHDVKTFTRSDGSDGKLKSFEVEDETGSIRVTLWGDDTDLINKKGDIVKIVGGSARMDDYTASGYSLNTSWNTQILLNPALSDEEEFAFNQIIERLGPVSIESLLEYEDDGIEVDVIGRILSIGDLREFQRDDGSVGNVRSVEFSDGTGIVRLSLWDTKADYDFKVGDPYLFENVRTKLGMYAVDLNVGSTSRIRKLTQEEEFMLPSYETIEEMIYTTETIDEIDEDDQNIRVIARIFEVNEPREFNKQDGTTGRLRRIEIADMTGSINLVLWNEDVDIEYGVGDAIKIDNPRIQYNDNENRLELQTGGNTSILTPSVNEIENLPSFEELQELVYQTRTISTIEDGDVNIRIKGIITDPSNNKILLAKCPSCNNSIDEFAEEGETCDYCGAEIDEPKYTLMIPARLKDYDSEDDIAITFFGRLAEDLLDITTKDAVELINDSDDLGVLDGRVDDLEGLNIEIIADVDFDEYSEQTRLKPKKILSKEY